MVKLSVAVTSDVADSAQQFEHAQLCGISINESDHLIERQLDCAEFDIHRLSGAFGNDRKGSGQL